jgi:hypothetical protein
MTLAFAESVAQPVRTVAGVVMCAMLAATTVFAQGRFQATDATGIAGLPDLRIVSIRDVQRGRCYLAFVENPSRVELVPAEPPDVAAAASRRDRDLADLVHTYENDTSVYAGTVTPNPLKYEVLAGTTQINFALTVIQNLLARLEAQLDRVAANPVLAVMPDVCATPDTRAPPP